jgi:uncharacterized protein CbrC (UPF0167 family)
MARHASLGDFGRAFKGRTAKLESEVARVLKETALNVVTEVARDTPILTGQAQSNWLTNIGSPFPFYVANEDVANGAAQDSIDWAKRVLQRVQYTDTIHITNNVPYIVKLNRGTSKQAPALFVQTAVLRAAYKIQGIRISWN